MTAETKESQPMPTDPEELPVAVDDAEYRDPDADARVAALVRRWAQAIATARDSATQAQAILAELANCDDELFESSAAADAHKSLTETLSHLWRAGSVAAGRLKLVEHAERDAEIKRLRERNAELERRLAQGAAS
jgi:anti-sigma-K factor RskA